MSVNSILWHDYETSGTSPALDRPLQFAAIRTDENLNIIGEPFSLYCRPSREILPHPEACLITGITPQKAEAEGVPEREFIARIHGELMVPGTCGAGYNSLRFDDEVTRYTLYRNFYDPYEREWRNGNSRWDIIDMLRLTHALRPEGITWPVDDDGKVSFRLEILTAANGISHQDAHDALSDVHATIAMARLVRERQPRLYDYVYSHRRKQQVAALLDVSGKAPFLHVSSRLPRETAYTALMIPLCSHPVNSNAVLCFNLSQDPGDLMALDAEQLRERVFSAAADLPEGVQRVALKAVHLNKCPVVATPKLLDEKAAQRLGIDLEACRRHWRQLRDQDLAGKLRQVFAGEGMQPSGDAETALYSGFIPDQDKPLLARVRKAQAPELAVLQSSFSDARYRELLFRYRARNFPDSLPEEEQHSWEEFREQMLAEPGPGRLGLDQYYERLEQLEREGGLAAGKLDIIRQLREWGEFLVSQ